METNKKDNKSIEWIATSIEIIKNHSSNMYEKCCKLDDPKLKAKVTE